MRTPLKNYNKATIQAEHLVKSDGIEVNYITISHPIMNGEGGVPVTTAAKFDYEEEEATRHNE